ncbi:cytoplasmic protein [Meredithblackwellia eburnea MCA 4105]
MVLFYESNVVTPPVQLYVGKDKVENEDLIKFAIPQRDVWVHVDKLSSAHVYIRMPEGMKWDEIPKPLLDDAAQLVKANSIQGNKQDNITVIYTPCENLKKTGDMAVGAVSFHSDKKVKRVHVPERVNAIVNRLNKTKKVVEVDHEAELIARQKEEGKKKRLEANERKNSDLELARQRKQQAEDRGYVSLIKKQEEEDEDEEWERKQKVGDYDPDEDFM